MAISDAIVCIQLMNKFYGSHQYTFGAGMSKPKWQMEELDSLSAFAKEPWSAQHTDRPDTDMPYKYV